MKKNIVIGLLVACLFVVVLMIAVNPAGAQANLERFVNILVRGNATFENPVYVAMPTAIGTATPMVKIQAYGVANPLEIRNVNATPVFYVDADGNATYTGFSSGGGAVTDAVLITAPTAVGTATPALAVDSLGAGNVLLDVRDSATPVFSINNGGGWTSTGAGTHSSGQTVNNWAKVAAPTAIATATPAMVVDSLGVSTILEVRDAATPVFTVLNGGDWTSTGAGTHSSGQTVNNWAKVAAPTAIATATPAMVVDSLGVSTILEVRDAATPVFTVNNGGTVTGLVLRYASAGQQIVAGSATVTDTATIASGLTTVTYCSATLAQAIAGDAAAVNCRKSAGNIIIDVKTPMLPRRPTQPGRRLTGSLLVHRRRLL